MNRQESREFRNEQLAAEGQRRLKIYRRLREKIEDAEFLKTLAEFSKRNRNSDDLSADFKAALAHAVTDVVMEKEGMRSFDGITFPTEDPIEIVRCVMESTCPTCGRHAFLTGLDRVKVDNPAGDPFMIDLPDYDDRVETTVECGAGHRAVASPHYNGDWSGWIECRHFAGFDYLWHAGA